MAQMLISVKNVQEADIALRHGADIIDLKDPGQGALGALPITEIHSIIDFVANRKAVSATIGDIPMVPELIVQYVMQLQGIRLNYLKIGFFETPDYLPCLKSISLIKTKCQPLIAVLFAEIRYPDYLIAEIKKAGFIGIMFDTSIKNGSTYQEYFSEKEFEQLASEIAAQQLLFGVAGSLHLSHVDSAKNMKPDFMGFRGGVCQENKRQAALDSEKIIQIKNALKIM